MEYRKQPCQYQHCISFHFQVICKKPNKVYKVRPASYIKSELVSEEDAPLFSATGEKINIGFSVQSAPYFVNKTALSAFTQLQGKYQ